MKIAKTWFQDNANGSPKNSIQWANFLVGFGSAREERRRSKANVVIAPIFPKNKKRFITLISHLIQSVQLQSKNGWVMAKFGHVRHFMGIIWQKINICELNETVTNWLSYMFSAIHNPIYTCINLYWNVYFITLLFVQN